MTASHSSQGECGLKFHRSRDVFVRAWRHSSQGECGLKCCLKGLVCAITSVTPRKGSVD